MPHYLPTLLTPKMIDEPAGFVVGPRIKTGLGAYGVRWEYPYHKSFIFASILFKPLQHCW
jgi:hypothetical protein